jgi:hypothetical protein
VLAMDFFHFSLGFLSSGLLGFYFTKNNREGKYATSRSEKSKEGA